MSKSIRSVPAGWIKNPDGSFSKPKGQEIILLHGDAKDAAALDEVLERPEFRRALMFGDAPALSKSSKSALFEHCGVTAKSMLDAISGVREFIVEHEPVAAPRMTRQDKWLKRPRVMRYREFCAAVKSAAGVVAEVPDRIECNFYVTMPESWSKKKQASMAGKPHRQRLDVDNMLKGVSDALFEQDGAIHEMEGRKRWCYPGQGCVVVKLFFFS